MKTKTPFALLLFCLSAISIAHAQSELGQRRGPPGGKEAMAKHIAACEGLQAGAACTTSGKNDEAIAGLCAAKESRPLACRPEGGRPRRRERDQPSAEQPQG